jgi:hypothetical protein
MIRRLRERRARRQMIARLDAWSAPLGRLYVDAAERALLLARPAPMIGCLDAWTRTRQTSTWRRWADLEQEVDRLLAPARAQLHEELAALGRAFDREARGATRRPRR